MSKLGRDLKISRGPHGKPEVKFHLHRPGNSPLTNHHWYFV